MKTILWMVLAALIVMIYLYSGSDKKQQDPNELPVPRHSQQDELIKSQKQQDPNQLPMPKYPEEHELVKFKENGRVFQLHPDAFTAWEKMRDAAKTHGIQLHLVSAFRSIARQTLIVENKRKRGLSDEEIFKVSARPGYSQHHTGKAVDLTTPGFVPLEEEFEKSEAFIWLTKNAASFGFYLSYPRGNKYGIAYEPWHWFYKGETM